MFGESILNDAVAIVLTTTVLESNLPEMAELSTLEQVWHGITRFLVIFLGSAGEYASNSFTLDPLLNFTLQELERLWD